MTSVTNGLFGADYSEKFHQVHERLREMGAVHVAHLPNGVRVWVVVRYAEAREALADPRLSKDSEVVGRVMGEQLAGRGQGGDLGVLFGPSMLFSDGARHRRLRKLVGAAFTAARTEALRPRVLAVTAELLDRMAGVSGPVDLVAEFAFPLPLTVICELLAVPEADRGDLRAWTTALIDAPPGQAGDASGAMVAYLSALIEDRRARPGGDLLSALLAASDGADRLTPRELVSTAALLLVAGHETTTSVIGNAARWLLGEPRGWAELAERPELVAAVTEDLMRLDGPGKHVTYRVSTEAVTYGGTTIPAGEVVLVSQASANRDRCRWAEADSLRRDRSPGELRGHLAFGYGPHQCLGAALGRMEVRIAIGQLVARFPRARLAVEAGELRRTRSALMANYESLPVLLRP